MRRIYHNWYSRRMKVCFVVLRIIHMIFKISHSTSERHADRPKNSIIITKIGIKRVSLCMRLLVACVEVEHSKETGRCVRRNGSPRCGVCVGCEAGWCWWMNVAVWVDRSMMLYQVLYVHVCWWHLVLCSEEIWCTRRRILKWMRACTGSQWSSLSIKDMHHQLKTEGVSLLIFYTKSNSYKHEQNYTQMYVLWHIKLKGINNVPTQ